MKYINFFLIISLLFFIFLTRTFSEEEMIEGWGDALWGMNQEEIQNLYGITSHTSIVSQDSKYITISKLKNNRIEFKQGEHKAVAEFIFDYEGLLISVEVIWGKDDIPIDVNYYEILMQTYGSCGEKEWLNNTGEIIGKTYFWIRTHGTLEANINNTVVNLTFHNRKETKIPTPLMQAIDDHNMKEALFLITAGTELNERLMIFEDENGNPAEGTITDYAINLYLGENGDMKMVYKEVFELLAKKNADTIIFEEDALEIIINELNPVL